MSRFSQSVAGAIAASVVIGVVTLVALTTSAAARANGPPAADQNEYVPQTEMRWGGALEESYQYHRQEPNGNLISPATGWHHYGFPVESYRWGWFGAVRYYPRVLWHEGYYGDKCRWAYRCGY